MTNRKRKGISPIIATVLLIAITIAAGLAIYGWVSGLISAGTSSRIVGTTSLTLTLEEVNSADNSATILIRNEGSYNVILNSTNIELVASDGTVTTPVSTSPSLPLTVPAGRTATLTIKTSSSGTYTLEIINAHDVQGDTVLANSITFSIP